jgi:glyceraldehyde 3-phosphate dehydrogenase
MAKVRVAINGFGRIGRNVVRAIYESGRKDIDIVSINDLGPVETNAHLLRFDSVHGRFPHEVTTKGDSISIGTDTFKVTAVKDPSQLPHKDMHRHFHREGQGERPSHRRCKARHRVSPLRRR